MTSENWKRLFSWRTFAFATALARHGLQPLFDLTAPGLCVGGELVCVREVPGQGLSEQSLRRLCAWQDPGYYGLLLPLEKIA